jgi:AcrR family transcriptional regulator
MKRESSRTSRPSAKAPSRGGTLGSRRRPPDEARRSILAAADRLFYENGVVSVGVDAVAEAARVTKRTLYYHFPSKDDLVAAYLEARDEATLSALRSTPGRGGSRPGDHILGVFDYVERWCDTPAYRGCPFNNAVAEHITSPKVAAVARRHKATVQSWFAQRAAEGGARDAEAVGARLLVLLDGALNGAAVFGSSSSAATASAMAETLLEAAGIERSPPSKRR